MLFGSTLIPKCSKSIIFLQPFPTVFMKKKYFKQFFFLFSFISSSFYGNFSKFPLRELRAPTKRSIYICNASPLWNTI